MNNEQYCVIGCLATVHKFLGVTLQNDLKWEQQFKNVGNKMNKLGNMILHKVEKVVGIQVRVYLLEICAFSCWDVSKMLLKDVEKCYHWLIKRAKVKFTVITKRVVNLGVILENIFSLGKDFE